MTAEREAENGLFVRLQPHSNRGKTMPARPPTLAAALKTRLNAHARVSVYLLLSSKQLMFLPEASPESFKLA
jgi:hypothetical protein